MGGPVDISDILHVRLFMLELITAAKLQLQSSNKIILWLAVNHNMRVTVLGRLRPMTIRVNETV